MRRYALAIAVVVLAVIYIASMNGHLGVTADHHAYVLLAQALVEGRGYRDISSPEAPKQLHNLQPLYSVFIASVVLFFGTNFFMIKLLNIIFIAVVLAVANSWLATQKFKYRLHLLAIFALLPFTLFFVSNIQSEMLYLALSVPVIALLDRASVSVKKWRSLFFAVVFAYLSFLARPMGIAAVECVIVCAVVFWWKGRIPLSMLMKTLGLAVILVGGTVTLFSMYDAETSSGVEHILLRDIYRPELGRAGVDDMLLRIPRNAFDYAGFALVKDTRRIGFGAFPGMAPLVLLVGIACWVLVVWGVIAWRKSVAFIYLIFYLFILAVYGWTTIRYLYPLMPFLLFYLFHGADDLLQRLRFSRKSIAVAANAASGLVVAGCLIFSFYYIGVQQTGRDYSMEWKGYEDVSVWSRTNLPPSARIMCIDGPFFFLHSGLRCAPMSDNVSVASFESTLSEGDYGYIVLDPIESTTEIIRGYNEKKVLIDHVLADNDRFEVVHQQGGSVVLRVLPRATV